MSQLSLSLDSSLLVRDVTGDYRPANADEVLQAAQRLLGAQLRGREVLSSPQAVRDFLRVKLGGLELAPQHVTRLAKLKKADIASEAERLAEGTGWMPAMFRSEDSIGAAQDATDGTPEEGTQDAAAEVEEVVEALAA